MLIRFFKASFYSQYLLLFVLAAGLWIKVYIEPCPQIVSNEESPLFNILSALTGTNGLVHSIIAFIILFISAILLNFILIRHELLPKNSMLGAFVYIVLMSHSGYALSINPALCAGFFIILAVDQILLTYGKADPTQQVFSASFLIAVASLLYFPAITLILLLIFSFVIFGTFSIRIFLVGVAGLFAVYLYLLVIYFLSDNLEGQIFLYLGWFTYLPGFVFPQLGIVYMIWGLITLLFVAALLHLFGHLNEWNISVRKKVLLNLWFILITFLTLVYENDNLPLAIIFMGVPLTILISGFFANRKRTPILLEVYLLIILVVIIINNAFIAVC